MAANHAHLAAERAKSFKVTHGEAPIDSEVVDHQDPDDAYAIVVHEDDGVDAYLGETNSNIILDGPSPTSNRKVEASDEKNFLPSTKGTGHKESMITYKDDQDRKQVQFFAGFNPFFAARMNKAALQSNRKGLQSNKNVKFNRLEPRKSIGSMKFPSS